MQIGDSDCSCSCCRLLPQIGESDYVLLLDDDAEMSSAILRDLVTCLRTDPRRARARTHTHTHIHAHTHAHAHARTHARTSSVACQAGRRSR
jgi:hypothetical protein